jgi:IMP dehydrogenase
MKNALGTLRQAFDDNVHIMAGNVATLEGINALAEWGAQSIRCNIGGGSICSTRIQTGHGLPGLQTIFDCADTHHDVAIIADGGIRTSGDIVKALAAGADFVMLGSLLAGTLQSPGDVVTTPEGLKKRYRGMASKDAQMDWRGRYSSNEGVSTFIKYKGEVKDVLQDLRGGIVSGFSYSGARNLTSLQNEAVWVKQTGPGLSESKTHINK